MLIGVVALSFDAGRVPPPLRVMEGRNQEKRVCRKAPKSHTAAACARCRVVCPKFYHQVCGGFAGLHGALVAKQGVNGSARRWRGCCRAEAAHGKHAPWRRCKRAGVGVSRHNGLLHSLLTCRKRIIFRGAHVGANEAHKLEWQPPRGHWVDEVQGSRVSCCRVQHHGVKMKDGDHGRKLQHRQHDDCASGSPNAGTLAPDFACIGQARVKVRLRRLRFG